MDAQLMRMLQGHPQSQYMWVTGFEEEDLHRFMHQFFELESDPQISVITIYISSYGGDVMSLNAMRDIIKSSRKPVSTVAMGKCMSAGACLLAAGQKGLRFVSPSSTIMIHELSSGTWGKESEIQSSAEWLKIINKSLLSNLSKDMGVSYEYLRSKMDSKNNTDWYINAQEAVKEGVADQVGIPRIVEESAMSLATFAGNKAPRNRKPSVKPKKKPKTR